MSGQTFDVHEELAQARIGSYHIKLGVLLALVTFFDGYDTFNPAYVIHFVHDEWHLSLKNGGMLVSSGLIGFLVGAALHGLAADRLGRRVTLLAGLWITTIFSALTALLAHSFGIFCVLRLLTGIGLGVLLPLSTTYLTELAPTRVANRFALWGVALGWAAGGTAAGLVGIFVTPLTGWRGLYWIGALSILLIPLMNRYLPESPKFLLLQQRTGEIRRILSLLRPERAAYYASASVVGEPGAKRVPVSALLSARYRVVSLAIWVASFLSLYCIFALSGWIPTLMQSRGETFAASFGFGALMQCTSFVGALVCGYLTDRLARPRVWLALWWLFGAAAITSMALFHDHAINLASTAAAGFFIIGAQFVLNNFTAASYDTAVRATGVGMELGVGRFGAILGPYIGGVLQQAYGGESALLRSVAIAATLAAVVILFARRASATGLHRESRDYRSSAAT